MVQIKLNQKIPGWNMLDIQSFLGRHVSCLPEEANILEIGGFFGRTSYVLGHNKPTTAKLITVDPWMTYDLSHFVSTDLHDGKCGEEELALLKNRITPNPDRIEGDDFLELWKFFTAGIPNHEYVREFSPPLTNNRVWPIFDFIYHDGAHDGDTVYKDLCFWFPKLKSNGLLIMDDYEKVHFHDLCGSVDKFVEENNLHTQMIGHRNILLRRKT